MLLSESGRLDEVVGREIGKFVYGVRRVVMGDGCGNGSSYFWESLSAEEGGLSSESRLS